MKGKSYSVKEMHLLNSFIKEMIANKINIVGENDFNLLMQEIHRINEEQGNPLRTNLAIHNKISKIRKQKLTRKPRIKSNINQTELSFSDKTNAVDFIKDLIEQNKKLKEQIKEYENIVEVIKLATKK